MRLQAKAVQDVREKRGRGYWMANVLWGLGLALFVWDFMHYT